MNGQVFLNHTTWRDGEQARGVAFTAVELAESLATARRSRVEIGTPVMGADEVEAIRAAVVRRLPVRLTAWCRMAVQDLDAAIESDAIASEVDRIPLLEPRISRLRVSRATNAPDATVSAQGRMQ
ncbi:hypothetical protein [Allomesorhizobium camelthorni]|uniref:Homocitrate synthase n=1 Tax=Allomesorhizobium camelthorni TaxID=475069 RepID=A0A6G4WGL0_9HYPH|nr:hypothetical protein [Mesorhizobium camelthorni]NGO53333.1 hypothetical protein [Mesorhizobium camelthorni]